MEIFTYLFLQILIFFFSLSDSNKKSYGNPGAQFPFKFFAGDTMLFSIVKDPLVSAVDMNHDLSLISQWAHQWKMEFNPDPTTRQFRSDNLVSTCAQNCREDIKFRKGCKITGFSMQLLHILNSSNSIASLYIS